MDAEKIRQMVEVEGKSLSQVARELDVNVGQVSYFCKKHKIKSKHMALAEKKQLPIQAIYEQYNSGVSLHQLSKTHKTSIPTLKRHLSKIDGVKFRSMDEAKRPPILNDKVGFEEMASKYSFREIARRLGVKANTVCAAGKRLGVKSAFEYEAFDVAFEELKALYVDQKLSIPQIAKKYNKSYGVVLRRLRKLGFVIAKPGGRPRPSKHYRLNDKEWLHDQYVVRKRSMGDLAGEIGTMLGNVSYHLKKYEIPLRTKEEYIKLLLDRSDGYIYYHGKRLDSKIERQFLKSMGDPATIVRNVEFESEGSVCFIDFLIDGEYYEVKSRERSATPGPNRRRLVKQVLVAKDNDVDVKVWNGKLYDLEITDEDKYYCINWKLIFKDHKQCSDWLLDYGFNGVRYPIHDLCRAIKGVKAYKAKPGYELNAAFPNQLICNLIKHFSQHYWRSTHKDFMSIPRAWEVGNQVVLKSAVERLWREKREVNLYGLVKLIGKFYKDFTPVSIFKPWIARYIYDKYLPEGGTVIDPCMGWGGRLLATLDSDYRYRGYDLNPMAVKSHRELRGFLGSRLSSDPEFVCADSGECDFGEADLIFTSPPYNDTEVYYGLEEQCEDSSRIIGNIFGSSVDLIILNVPKWYSADCCRLAEERGFVLSERLDMKTASFMGREKTSEPILVFRRER